jgi:hypothetical protein
MPYAKQQAAMHTALQAYAYLDEVINSEEGDLGAWRLKRIDTSKAAGRASSSM